MPRKWTEAQLQAAQEHRITLEDKRQERLRKDEEDRQERLRKTEALNQKHHVAGSKRNNSRPIRQPKAKGRALTGSFEDAVRRLHQSLEGNEGSHGASEVERVAVGVDRLFHHPVTGTGLEKTTIDNLIGICSDPKFSRITRSKAVGILRRYAQTDMLTSYFAAIVRETETDRRLKTCAALSLVWLDTNGSISALIGLVDELTDGQKNECILELRPIRSHERNLALSVFQRHLPATPRVPPLQADQPDSNELSWTILPIGWWGIPSYQRLATQRSRDRQSGELVLERLRFLDELNPKERYIGRDRFGSDPYWVFIFDKHVVAECPMEGNAVFIVDGIQDWRTLLNRSKRDLKVVAPNRYKRIVHRGDWKSRVINTLGTDVRDLR